VTRPVVALASLLLSAVALSPAWGAETCAHPETALGVSRIIEIDTKSGPLFGEYSKLEREPRFLGPKEVVLTFDDGPLPRYTKPILDALDQFCTKATFFNVGEMAMAYPNMVKEVIGRGHTVGAHTWSHPMNMRHMSLDKAEDQIERGFAAVALAAGRPVAPFFRFPGLSDSGPMLAYLQERGIASFTVDIVSNDSYIGSPQRLIQRTMAQIAHQNGGIVLFHDIKASTAKALPTILADLKKGGYKIVMLRPKAEYTPLPALTAELEAKRAKAEEKEGGKPKPVPTFTSIPPSTLEATSSEPAVTELAPEPRERTHVGGTPAMATAPVTTDQPAAAQPASHKRRYSRKAHVTKYNTVPSLGAIVSGNF
jgi:peptidoglycan-N-acetylglucosamine deacetylase